jgi:hypothetical protein
MSPDATALLRELRAAHPDADPESPQARAALDGIVLTPPDPARSPWPARRPRGRLALAAATLAVATVAALGVVPGSSPDVLAQAARALDDEDAILHFRTETRLRSRGAELLTREPDAKVDASFEAWQADGGRRERFIHDGAGEWVRDWDAKVSMAYNVERDELIHHTDPDVFGPAARPRGIDDPTPIRGTVIGDLQRLLERARRGEENVLLVGETSVRGIDVYELQIEYTTDSVVLPGAPSVADPEVEKVKGWRTLYVDRERFLPVRVIERGEWKARGGTIVQSITDYVEAEHLPRTAENEKLLEMSPHPGAKVIREGRL